MTAEDPDDVEWWAEIYHAMQWQPCEADHIREAAANDQRDLAIKEAEGYSYSTYPAKKCFPQLEHLAQVRDKRLAVMEEHRGYREYRDDWPFSKRLFEVNEGPNRLPGLRLLPDFDEHNPEHARGIFLIFANAAHELNVIKPEVNTLENALDARARPDLRCDWSGPPCNGKASQFLLLAQGQFLVAVPTCDLCLGWLVRMCPEVNFPKPPPPHWGNIRRG